MKSNKKDYLPYFKGIKVEISIPWAASSITTVSKLLN